jgi:two-component system, chemotaxis family, protein-glutamate methylesterase/glutaminase
LILPDPKAAIRVLLVEDSPAMCDLLVYILNADPRLQVIAVAVDGEQAVLLAQRLKPDVILMDIHLPKMNGFVATRKIMESCPTRIVMVTATSIPGEVAATFQALESGALTVMAKPPGIGHQDHRRLADELLQNVKLMSEVQVVKRWSRPATVNADASRMPHGPHVSNIARVAKAGGHIRVVAIGASTGGPLVLREILSLLSAELEVPILIVQHISSGFTDGFIEWLQTTSGYKVQLAKHCEIALAGIAYVAPDGLQMKMQSDGTIALQLEPLEHGMRPSVSFLFRSMAENFGANAIGVLLTGMGKDGAQELKLMQQAGAITIAQDRESSVVYGMPGEAVKLDAVSYVLTPDQISRTVAQLVKQRLLQDKEEGAIGD